MTDDIVRLPPLSKWMGSCPNCGKSVWSNDKIKEWVYRCVQCRFVLRFEDLIPF